MTPVRLLRFARVHPLLVGGVIVAVIALACGSVFLYMQINGKAEDSPTPPGPRARPPERKFQPPQVPFKDITAQAGIHFRHVNGVTPFKFLPETMGSGVAFLDYDGDGYQDILFVNSRYWPGFDDGKPQPTLALYRNKGVDAEGKHLGFEDVTAKVFDRDDISFFGMGVAAGDFDNDGHIDVLLTGMGECRLFHNVADPDAPGGRRFVNVTRDSPDLARSTWPNVRTKEEFQRWDKPVAMFTSATFLDYDGDGLLDLFICSYVDWSPLVDNGLHSTAGGEDRAYAPPNQFKGTQCYLFRNLGPEKGYAFSDVSAAAGIHVFDNVKEEDPDRSKRSGKGEKVSKALGVIVCDVDEDGWPDLIVANDEIRNFFFHNKGVNAKGEHQGFEEMALTTGLAYAESSPRGGMGIDWGEYNPGRCGLVICNFANEPDTFFRQEGPRELRFSDVAVAEGLAGASQVPVKWSAFFFDYDLDGRLDLFSCNGNLDREVSRLAAQDVRQPAHLFWNTGDRKVSFAKVGQEEAGPDLFKPIVGRGGAFGDLDNDGRLDIVLCVNNGEPLLLHNEGKTGNHYLRLVLEGDGKRSNRSAIGARVQVVAGDLVQNRSVVGGRGYLSQSELPLTFGLGQHSTIDRVTIQWPGRNAGPPLVLTGQDLQPDRTYYVGQDGSISTGPSSKPLKNR